jgi:Transposase IS66 family
LVFLGNCARYLQVDAYQGYDAFFAQRRAQAVACWAHTWRKLFDAEGSDPGRAV